MAFEKGMEKSGGREKGVSNKSTTRIRNIFEDLLSEKVDQIKKDLDEMRPIDRVNCLIRMAEFCIPKLQSIDGSLLTEPVEFIIVDGTD